MKIQWQSESIGILLLPFPFSSVEAVLAFLLLFLTLLFGVFISFFFTALWTSQLLTICLLLFNLIHDSLWCIYLGGTEKNILNNAVEDVIKTLDGIWVKGVKAAQWVQNSESQTEPNGA